MKSDEVNDPVDAPVIKSQEVTTAKKLKQFEEFRQSLDKFKTEFYENFKKKSDNFGSLSDFEITCTLGQGSFGSMVLSKHKESNKYYAIKILNKAKLIKDKQIEHTLNERNVLNSMRFPFCIHMEFCFKDNCNIYFVLPFIAGGDMFSLLRKLRTIGENDAKFYAAQVILALEYIHFLDLVYRDLKPENIMIDVTGYVKLTDFGFTKVVKFRTYTLCGTPEYLAPEIILNRGYSKCIDWWSVGIFIYEMLAGHTPFYADEPLHIYEKITSGKFRFTTDFSFEARDLVRKFLQTNTSKRYGNLKNGVIDIKMHDWFKVIDWQAIYLQKVVSPFVPKVESPNDITYFDKFGGIKIQESVTEKHAKEFEDF